MVKGVKWLLIVGGILLILERCINGTLFYPSYLHEEEHVANVREIGRSYYIQGNYDKATQVLKNVLEDEQRLKKLHPYTIAGTFSNLGSCYLLDGEYISAISALEKALDYAYRSGNYDMILEVKNKVGMVYQRLQEYQNSVASFLDVYHANGVETKQSRALKNIALVNLIQIFIELDDIKIATHYLQDLKQVIKKEKNEEFKIIYYIYKAECEIAEGHFEETNQFLKKAIKLRQEHTPQQFVEIDLHLANVLGQYFAEKNEVEKAIELTKIMASEAEKVNGKLDYKEAKIRLYTYFKQINNEEEAYQCLIDYYRVDQAFEKSESIQYIEQLEGHFAHTKKTESTWTGLLLLLSFLMFGLICFMYRYVLENKILLEKSEKDVFLDVYNRHYLEEHLKKKPYNLPITGLMVDVDYFKKFNDYYGHQAGDNVLKIIAQLINKNIRKQDMVARYGGEEFFVLLEKANQEVGREISRRIQNELATKAISHDASKVTDVVTLSIGGFTAETPKEMNCLIEYADRALYTAKRRGRNQYVHYEEIE